MHKASRSLLYRWPSDLLASLNQDCGWRLAGKLIVVLLGLAGLWLTWQTFQTNLRVDQLRRAEEAYSAFVADLGSDSPRVRANAISRLPALLARRAHTRTTVSLWESLKLLLGVGTEGSPVFLEAGRRQLHDYLHTGPSPDALMSGSESRALVNALATMGAEGWFTGQPASRSHDRKTLAWLWTKPTQEVTGEAAPLARTILRGTHLAGVDLSSFDLSGADLSGAYLHRPVFAKAILNDSSFREAHIIGADFSNAQLRRAQMQKIRLEKTTLYGCEMQSANLNAAVVSDSYISRVVLSPLPDGPVTDASRVEFIDCTISDLDAQKANLFGLKIIRSKTTSNFAIGATHSDFTGANLRSSVLDYVNLSDSRLVESHLEAASARHARFNFADLRGAILDKADFSGADLSDAFGLTLAELRSGEGIHSCTHTNFANVKGLTAEQLNELVNMGAVIIPSAERWQSFKRQGFPARRWKEFGATP